MGEQYIFGKHHAFRTTSDYRYGRIEYAIKWWACEFRPKNGNGKFNKHDLSVIRRGVEMLGGYHPSTTILGKDMVSVEQWQDKYPAPILWAQFADAFHKARPMDFRIAPYGWSNPEECSEHGIKIGDVAAGIPHGPKWERLWWPLGNGADWVPFELGYDMYPDKIKKPQYFRLDARVRSR